MATSGREFQSIIKGIDKKLHCKQNSAPNLCCVICIFQELGDVENWSRVIEADMTSIASALEYAYKGTKYFEYWNWRGLGDTRPSTCIWD